MTDTLETILNLAHAIQATAEQPVQAAALLKMRVPPPALREGVPLLLDLALSRPPSPDHSRRVERLLRHLGVPACALAELRRRGGQHGAPGAAELFVRWLRVLTWSKADPPASLPVWSAAGYRLAAEDGEQALGLVVAWAFHPLGWLAAAAGLRPGEFAGGVPADYERLAFLAALRGQAWAAPFLASIRRAGYPLSGPAR